MPPGSDGGAGLQATHHSSQQKPPHALQVPGQVAWIAAAFATGIVLGAGRRIDEDIPAEPPQPGAQVNVLVVEKVGFVESACRSESLPPEYDEHAGNPVRRKNTLRGVVVRSPARRQELAQKGQGGGESASMVLDPSFRAYNQRRDRTCLRPLEISQDLREGVTGQTDVGIENAEILSVGMREGGIMVGAESLPLCVGQDLEGERVLLRGDGQPLRHVEGEDDFERHFRAAGQILQQTRNQGALTMADDGDRQDFAR